MRIFKVFWRYPAGLIGVGMMSCLLPVIMLQEAGAATGVTQSTGSLRLVANQGHAAEIHRARIQKTQVVALAVVTPKVKESVKEKQFHYINVAGHQMVRIPGGRFLVARNSGEDDEKQSPVVQVKSFLMGKYEVTQSQWHSVMGNNPSHFKGARRPVENISWEDAQEYIRKLNQRTGRHFRLPSEIEWEYAARASDPREFSPGGNLGSNLQNCFECGSQADGDRTAPVGLFHPNALGLYGIRGTIIEWLQDRNHESREESLTEGSLWESGASSNRFIPGGLWGFTPSLFSSSFHDGYDTGYREVLHGLRLVHDL